MSQEKNVELNIEELKGFLNHIINNNRHLQSQGKVPVTVNVEGGAGIGKTSAIHQVAKEHNLSFVRINLAQIEELGDLVGFPVRQFQMCMPLPEGGIKPMVKKMVKKTIETPKVIKKQVMEGGVPVVKDVTVMVKTITEVEEEVEATLEDTCQWIDEQAFDTYIAKGYTYLNVNRMAYCPPEWISNLGEGGILLVDDYTRADQRFLQACMTLIETQKYISWALPKDWHIILTTNPDDGEYLVTPMDSAQKTRFISVNLKFDVEVWGKWAEAEGIDSRCINFLLMHPELVTRDVNARSITTFFNCISSVPDFAKDLPLVKMIGDGSVGATFSTMFATFINNRLDKLISPKDMLLHKDDKFVIEEMGKSIGKGQDYRADIASVLTTRLINYSLHYAENNSIDQPTINRLINISTEENVLNDDLRYVLVKKLLTNKGKFQKIMVDQEVLKMASR